VPAATGQPVRPRVPGRVPAAQPGPLTGSGLQVINLTADTRPMHLHLVTFQVTGRTPFDADAYTKAYGGADGVPGGSARHRSPPGRMHPPAPDERGYKDTVKANPGYYTTIRAKFDLPRGVTAPQTPPALPAP
jgi:spore coat protein A